MDPCLVGAITAAAGAGAGFTLYKIIPELYNKLKQILGEFFYKSVVVTLAQNKLKAINLMKFMALFPEYKKIKCTSILIDGQEYEVPLIDVKFTVSGNNDYEFSMKANTDNIGNVVNVVVSTWKRDMLYEDDKCLETFDAFLKKILSVAPEKTQDKPQDKPITRAANGKVILDDGIYALKSSPRSTCVDRRLPNPRRPVQTRSTETSGVPESRQRTFVPISTSATAEVPKPVKPILGPLPKSDEVVVNLPNAYFW